MEVNYPSFEGYFESFSFFFHQYILLYAIPVREDPSTYVQGLNMVSPFRVLSVSEKFLHGLFTHLLKKKIRRYLIRTSKKKIAPSNKMNGVLLNRSFPKRINLMKFLSLHLEGDLFSLEATCHYPPISLGT